MNSTNIKARKLMNTILYRYAVPITFVFAFFAIIASMPNTIGQCIMSGIAGWYVGGWASNFGRWLHNKMNS